MNDALPHRLLPTERAARVRVVGIAVALTAIALLGARELAGALIPVRTETLGACVRDETLFPVKKNSEKSAVEQWRDLYHERVEEVVEEHVEFLKDGVSCRADGSRPPPLPKLAALVEDSEKWSEKEDVSQENAHEILIDYLAAYECALYDRSRSLEAEIAVELIERELGEKPKGETRAGETDDEDADQDPQTTAVGLVALDDEIQTQRRILGEEAAIARDALHRTLLYLSGHARLWRLQSSLRCVEGAMVDIRNALSLVADASACMPRVWDVQTFLRKPLQ